VTTELYILGLAIVHLLLASHAASSQRGYRWSTGPRGEPTPALTGLAGRLERAARNFGETFPLSAAALPAAHLAGRTGTLAL